MSAGFHTPSYGDKIFDLGDALTSTPASNNVAGKNNSMYMYQQQTPTSTKHMLSLQNTSDEYYTANEESYNVSVNHPITLQNMNNQNNITQESSTGPTTMAARKQMLSVDQTEPAKPLSAYALFFRDTVSAIKQQNPSSSFQELSKIVASMWDALDPVHKGVYNKKNELARVEYLKQMRIYQQQKQEQSYTNANETVQSDADGEQQTTAQQATPQPFASNISVQQTTDNQTISNNIPTAPNDNSTDVQFQSTNDTEVEQKCIRENCNKRAIINPDWEDEYCSNECVIIHCRNVFNDWVQSNLKARQQQQQQQQQATAT